jgi:nucleotide-binding universal stress UspA family protein
MRFLVCYDGSKASKKVLKLAQSHAKVWNASLDIVKTITREEPLKYEYIKKNEEELNREIADFLASDDPPFETQLMVTSLTSGEQLVKYAGNQQIDQIFLGIVKRSKVEKFIFGSTAQYIILHAPCPVMTVHVSES